jgi:hypothetical protein
MWNDREHVFRLIVSLILLCSGLQAAEECPVEVKLLLAPPTLQNVIESLNFEGETSGRTYFFDTDELDLLRQGVIVRVRQGANNDLTLKVRLPEKNEQADDPNLHSHFHCEIDKSGEGENISYSARRKYKVARLPERGTDISTQFSPPQARLLRAAGGSIDWDRVVRIADIKSTKWETSLQPFRNLSLELWEWPTGSILEISTKVGPDERQSMFEELKRLVKKKNLTLNSRQGTKTSMVLEAITHSTAPN